MEKKKTQCFLITSIPDLRISVCSPAKDAGGILPAGWPYINILDGKPDIGAYEILFLLTLHKGWNFVTIPSKNNFNASMLYQNISGCKIILKWNASKQQFEIYVPHSPYNFKIRNSIGYFIGVAYNTTLVAPDYCIKNVNVTLYMGWDMLGWFKESIAKASSLYGNISNCSILLKWMLHCSNSCFMLREHQTFTYVEEKDS